MGVLFYDKDGAPLDAVEWGRRFSDPEYYHVARDEVGRWTVFTAWHGHPASAGVLAEMFRPENSLRPIFVTVLLLPAFTADGLPFVLEAMQYHSLEFAEHGHARIVEWLARPGVVPLVATGVIDSLFLRAAAG